MSSKSEALEDRHVTAPLGERLHLQVEEDPAAEQAVLNLTLIRAPGDARRILQRYLAFNPVSGKAQARLAAIEKQER